MISSHSDVFSQGSFVSFTLGLRKKRSISNLEDEWEMKDDFFEYQLFKEKKKTVTEEFSFRHLDTWLHVSSLLSIQITFLATKLDSFL